MMKVNPSVSISPIVSNETAASTKVQHKEQAQIEKIQLPSIQNILNAFIEQSITTATMPQAKEAPLTAAAIQQLLAVFRQLEKDISGNQIKQLLSQILDFRPLNQAKTTPLSLPFNLLLSAYLLPKLSPKAGKLLKQQALSNKVLQELGTGGQQQAVGKLLKHISAQMQSSQIASHDASNQPNEPLFFHFPLPFEQQLRRIEAKISKNQAKGTTDHEWHLKMLLPVSSQTHILADVRVTHEKQVKIQFYSPDQYWLDKVNKQITLLEARLGELGIQKPTLQNQLGLIPESLSPKTQGQLDITI